MEEKKYKKVIQALRELDSEELRKENKELRDLIRKLYENYLKENERRKQLYSLIKNMDGLKTSLSVTDYDFRAYGLIPDNPYMLKLVMKKKEDEMEIYLHLKDFQNERHTYKKGVKVERTSFHIDVEGLLEIESEKKQHKEIDKCFTNKNEAENLKMFLHDIELLRDFDWEGKVSYLEKALYDDKRKKIEQYKQDQVEVLGLLYLKNKRL